MRLLALTSPAAEGSFTEAGEIIGEITFAGTVGFILFTGLAAGLLSAVLYALVRPVLPPGRAGGLALGLLLLVVAGTRVEPLVADNIDFVVLGPAWLAVLAFSALALFHGMLVAAVAARLSGQPPPALRAGPRAATAGRIATGAVLLVALPGFATAVADILQPGLRAQARAAAAPARRRPRCHRADASASARRRTRAPPPDVARERREPRVGRGLPLDRRDRQPRVAADLDRVGALGSRQLEPEQDRPVLGLGGRGTPDRRRALVEHPAAGREQHRRDRGRPRVAARAAVAQQPRPLAGLRRRRRGGGVPRRVRQLPPLAIAGGAALAPRAAAAMRAIGHARECPTARRRRVVSALERRHAGRRVALARGGAARERLVQRA